jgi:hypothetical protein
MIREKSNREKSDILRDMNLVNIIAKPAFLLYSQRNLKSQRKKVLGIDNILSHGITEAGFVKLAKEIKDNIYRPKPIKKVEIFSSDGKN